MSKRCIRSVQVFIFRGVAPGWLALFLVLAVSPLRAQTFDPTLTVGAGIQTSYQHVQTTGDPTDLDQFSLDHARLYFSGNVTSNISYMFNTDYTSSTDDLNVLDAAAMFNISPKIHVWAGRFLPPSDRANMYGPFYSNEWAAFTDGVQDGYPFVYQGRDNGVMYWGDFKAGMAKIKVSAGAFDGDRRPEARRCCGRAACNSISGIRKMATT